MKQLLFPLAALGVAACTHTVEVPSQPAETPAATARQADIFGPLADLAGTRWYAVPAEGSTEAVGDLQHWYWEFGGNVLAQRHGLEDGSYGGVTYIYPNGETGALDFVYVTSGGFHTVGGFEVNEDGSWTAIEDVTGHDTITKVRSTGRIDPEGTLHTRSEYLKSGEWIAGHAFTGMPTDRPVPDILPVSTD